MKFLLSWFLLSTLFGSYFVGLLVIVIIYLIVDKLYFGFTTSFLSVIQRKKRIHYYLSELKLNPQNAKSMYELGQLYFESKNYKKSVDYLLKALPKFPSSPQLFSYLGMSQICLKDFETGRENILKGLDIEKGVLYGLPYVYLISYELNQSNIDNSKIIEYEGWFDRYSITENYYRLGRIYKENSNKVKAHYYFDKAIESYVHCNKSFRKLHRRWAYLSRVRRYPIIIPIFLAIVLSFSLISTYSFYHYINRPAFEIPNKSLTSIVPFNGSRNDLKNIIYSFASYDILSLKKQKDDLPFKVALKINDLKDRKWLMAFKEKIKSNSDFTLKNDQNIFGQSILFFDSNQNSLTILRNCCVPNDLLKFFEAIDELPESNFTLQINNEFLEDDMSYLNPEDSYNQMTTENDNFYEFLFSGSISDKNIKINAVNVLGSGLNPSVFMKGTTTISDLIPFETNEYEYKTESKLEVLKLENIIRETGIQIAYRVEVRDNINYFIAIERAWTIAPAIVYTNYLKNMEATKKELGQ